MKYEVIQDKLIDFIDQSLSEQEMKEIQEHIDQNQELAQEVEEMRKIFFEMSEEEMEHPSASLRINFEQMLEEEKVAQKSVVINLQERTSWKSFLRVAASVFIVASAFVIGTMVNNTDNNQIEQVLATIENESSSQRIAALNRSENIETIDRRILEAFIDRMLYDEKPSVRLATVEALVKFASEEMVKVAFLKALEKDTDPAIQIELIQVLAKIEEKRALTPMKDLLNSEEVPEYVKKEIQYNISSLENS
jgi:hypothetical protein